MKKRRSYYSFGHWLSFNTAMLALMESTSARIADTLRNNALGEIRAAALAGDYKRPDLAEAIARSPMTGGARRTGVSEFKEDRSPNTQIGRASCRERV